MTVIGVLANKIRGRKRSGCFRIYTDKDLCTSKIDIACIIGRLWLSCEDSPLSVGCVLCLRGKGKSLSSNSVSDQRPFPHAIVLEKSVAVPICLVIKQIAFVICF